MKLASLAARSRCDLKMSCAINCGLVLRSPLLTYPQEGERFWSPKILEGCKVLELCVAGVETRWDIVCAPGSARPIAFNACQTFVKSKSGTHRSTKFCSCEVLAVPPVNSRIMFAKAKN